MYVRYISSVGSPKYGRNKWLQEDNACFDDVNGLDAYAKEVWFFPETKLESAWLSILGYERAARDKSIIGRVWTDCWVFHICVSGKGYYNDIPITRGTCFLSWPYIKHNFVADEEDPLEFYWIILSGPDVAQVVSGYGFSEDQLVFSVDCVDEIVSLFEYGMNTNYKNVNVYEYTMGLARMLLSFPKPSSHITGEGRWVVEQGKNYTKIAKRLLKNSNYTLSIAQLSGRIGISAKHLSRVFYEDTNELLKQYIVRKKFEFAANLMKNGMFPTEVANILKYANYASFQRMFVARLGMTPKAYMEKLKK